MSQDNESKSMTTDNLIEELERLEREATPGPWFAHDHAEMAQPERWHGYAWIGKASTHRDGAINRDMDGVVADIDRSRDGHKGYRDAAAPDARLIAALRNHLPAILSALKENKRMREALEFYAAKETWHGRVGDKGALLQPVATDDGGRRARAALQPQGEK